MTSLLALLLLPFALYVFFLAYVTLIHSQQNGKFASAPLLVRCCAYLILLVAGLLDVVFNVAVGSLLFFELPRELLFTTRCERHMRRTNWRGQLARWFCQGWLNPFDEDHCHPHDE